MNFHWPLNGLKRRLDGISVTTVGTKRCYEVIGSFGQFFVPHGTVNMVLDKNIRTSWSCPCGKEGMTQKEFRKHEWKCDVMHSPVKTFFPEYYICRCGDGADVYMKAEREFGPFYMAWDCRDYVDIMPAWELKRHEWEWIEREETPFPRFE